MDIKQCIMTNSLCYKQAGNVPQHFGIVVHSTGVNQPRISRYVQPSDDDPNKDVIIADIGKNPYHNDWNHPPANPTAADRKGVHCFIGQNAAGQVVCYQVLPWDNIAWGVWKGPNGSYNDNPPYFQFEICEDGLKDEAYFDNCMATAQALCAYLCQNFGIPVDKIVSHYESWEQGYGNQHVDPNNWMQKFGKDMDWFRNEVRKLLNQSFSPGDKVKLLSDTNVKGVKLAAWVTDGRPLYVVWSNDVQTAVSVLEDHSAITAVMWTEDVAPYDETPKPEPEPAPEPDPEPEPKDTVEVPRSAIEDLIAALGRIQEEARKYADN